MNDETLFPSYISRQKEEEQIRRLAARIRPGGPSQAVLLYGPGGVGKTRLVRQLAELNGSEQETIWVGPIDIDDSEYWLLSNLEKLIAEKLDPGQLYFRPYLDYLMKLPRYTRPRVGHETVVSHLRKIKRVFIDCYRNFIVGSDRTVVIIFDTVEAIRGMDLLVTLTQLMKELPATLFIMSGRPESDRDDGLDLIKSELEDPHRSIPVETIWLDDFPQDAARAYLNASGVAVGLTDEEKIRLVRLTRGHPLWLAFTVSYLHDRGLPEEANRTFAEIDRLIPYQGTLSKEGQNLQEAFYRRLVAPYRESDFWHEAIKRLAVARQSVSLSIWRELMADRPLPDGVGDLDAAWQTLLATPWIRPRANRQYVTLHDVVAEELAQRVIPLHDLGREWRRELWQRVSGIYADRIRTREIDLAAIKASLEDTERAWNVARAAHAGVSAPAEEESDFIDDVAKLDVENRELCQFKAVRLYYQLLCDFEQGCRLFLELLDEAKLEHDILFQELLAFEMERFLSSDASYPIGDVVGEVVDDFRRWLLSDGRQLHLEVGLAMVDYLIKREEAQAAMDLIARLPTDGIGHDRLFRLDILRGNACMRLAGQVKSGLRYINEALTVAMDLTGHERSRLVAEAQKELGFYYRNEGYWDRADDAYRSARDAISEILLTGSTDRDREEMASIQTNWAYVKGLTGNHQEGTNLVESAIAVRHRLNLLQEEGISWSVCGEVYRYERRFHMAWRAYTEAEQIFQGLRNWSWLGLIFQEQAICLYQAAEDGIELRPGAQTEAQRLITLALDLCSDLAIRGYPSALNRAGRIFGRDDPDTGLRYFEEGIEVARELSDGWFWFANLIEYVELSYRFWVNDRQAVYLDRIDSHRAAIDQVMTEYGFPDLQGRWRLLQGHLAIHKWLEAQETGLLSAALEHYKAGFALIAQRHVGSSGASAIGGEFTRVRELVWKLPAETREQWQAEFRAAWGSKGSGATVLLARLEELY